MPTLAEAQYLFKTKYVTNDKIEQFATDRVMHLLFKKNNQWISKLSGGQGSGTPAQYGMVWPIEDVRNNSFGMIQLTNPALVPPGSRQGTQAYANLAGSSIGVTFDSILFDASQTDETSFDNVVTRNLNSAFTDAQTQESRILWGDGSGQLGIIGAINGTTITLSTTFGGRPYPVTKFLQPGTLVTFLTSGYVAIANQTGIEITATDDNAGTFDVADVTGLNVGDYIFLYQSHFAASSTGIEPIGIRGIFGSTSTLYGIDPATHSKWVPAVVITDNTDPTEDFLAQMKAYIGIGGDRGTHVVTHPLVMEKHASFLKTYKRYNDTQVIGSGVKTPNQYQDLAGLDIVGVGPMIPDNNTPMAATDDAFNLAMFNVDAVFCGEARPMHWDQEDGDMLAKIVGGATVSSPSYARYVGYLVHFWQTGCYRRKSGAFASSVNYLKSA
jgi:hypothetical protein